MGHVMEMKAGGGLIQNIKSRAGAALGQFLGQLDALGFAARQRRGVLAQANVGEAHVHQGMQLAGYDGDVFEEVAGDLNGHVEHFGDILALVADLQRFPVVALALADVAGHVDVGQEVHLDLDDAVALARLPP